MNCIILTGRLVSEPTIRTTKTGKQICDITLAVDRGEKSADFINVCVWGAAGDSVYKYKHKGDLVGVVGTLRVENKQQDNGIYKTFVHVNTERVEFIQNAKQNEPKEETPEAPADNELPF